MKFKELKLNRNILKALAEAGELSGVNVSIQREDVFNFMYRL